MRGILDEDIEGASTEAATPPPSNKKQTRLPFAAKSDAGPAAPAGTKRKLDPALSKSKTTGGDAAKKAKASKKTAAKADPTVTTPMDATAGKVLTAAEKVRRAMARY
jgi:hypothetical protein